MYIVTCGYGWASFYLDSIHCGYSEKDDVKHLEFLAVQDYLSNKKDNFLTHVLCSGRKIEKYPEYYYFIRMPRNRGHKFIFTTPNYTDSMKKDLRVLRRLARAQSRIRLSELRKK